MNGTQQDRNFEYTGYSKVFNSFVDMHQIIDSNVKHTAKTKALRVAWATSAGYVSVISYISLLIVSPQRNDGQAFCGGIL